MYDTIILYSCIGGLIGYALGGIYCVIMHNEKYGVTLFCKIKRFLLKLFTKND